METALNTTSAVKFKIGLCQLSVTSDKNRNILKACNFIKLAADKGAKLVVLPEMWNCPYSTDYFAKFAEDFDKKELSPSVSMLSEAAYRYGITIVGGSIPEWNNGRLYNTCCVFGPDGKLKAKHRKIHLFDIDVQGDISFKESDTFSAGDDPTIVDTEIGRIGVGICHDIRFPELAMIYKEKGCQLICYPGAFNISTGEMLWEMVQRARAADNQLFVATCSPSRDSCGHYEIWGHSTMVGPFGEVIASCGDEETLLVAEIDNTYLQIVRESFAGEEKFTNSVYQFNYISDRNRNN